MSGLRQIAKSAIARLSPDLLDGLRAARQRIKNARGAERIFSDIYENNGWDGTESVSGPGSTLEKTRKVRRELPLLLQQYAVNTLLDLPCGDVAWIGDAIPKDVSYIGGDIVAALIERNRRDHGQMGEFLVLDLIKGPLPKADLALVRDCLIHLPNSMAKEALRNIKASGIRYLLTTSYVGVSENQDIELGGFRPVNLALAPFNMPAPLAIIHEFDDPAVEHGKSLMLWDTSAIPNT